MDLKQWKPVTRCPYCSGELVVSIFYSLSHDYRITKKGVISRRYSVSDLGSMDCITAFCRGCERSFDNSQVAVENDGKVYIRMEEE